MNKIKSLFIGMFPMLAMGITGYSFYQIMSSGLSFVWLGAAMTTLPIMLFISRVMMFKNMARTSNHFPLMTTLAVFGLGAATYEFIITGYINQLGIILTGIGFITFMLYNFWYSSLGRNTNVKLQVGRKLPIFTANNTNGNSISSYSLLGQPVIFIFFRGNWCPLCMAQIKEIAAKYRELASLNVKIILISPQPEKNTQVLADKFEVPFMFLTDIDNKAAQTLGIEMKNGLPAGMEMFGYEKDTVYPTVLITDQNGKIIYSDATNNYRIRPEPEEFIKVLKTNALTV
ncbi:MAG: redoxin domain-containing protein [Methylophaga sp.]|nr:redoxin domain-containing protein [Methylophaga sp.]